MPFRTVFGLEGNPLEFIQFEGDKSIPCLLCKTEIVEGIAVIHENGNEVVFCHSCFAFLQEGFDSIKARQLAIRTKENQGVRT